MGLNNEALRPTVDYIRANGLAQVYKVIENPTNFQALRTAGRLEIPGLTIDASTFGLALIASLRIPGLLAKEQTRIRAHSGVDPKGLKFFYSAIKEGSIEAASESNLNALGWFFLTCLHSVDVRTMLQMGTKSNVSDKLHQAINQIWGNSSDDTESIIDPRNFTFEKQQSIFYLAASGKTKYPGALYDLLYEAPIEEVAQKYKLSENDLTELLDIMRQNNRVFKYNARPKRKPPQESHMVRITRRINQAFTTKTVRKIFDELTENEAKKLAKSPQHYLVLISSVLDKTKFRNNTRLVHKAILRIGRRVPLLKADGAYYLSRNHIQRVQEVENSL